MAVSEMPVDVSKNRPKIVDPAIPAVPVLRHFSKRGEELEFSATVALRFRWSKAVHRPVVDAADPTDVDSGYEPAVYKVMAKRGQMHEQWESRHRFEVDKNAPSAGLRRTMMVWPMWVSTGLCIGPVGAVRDLPSLIDIDAVAKRWSLDAFDAKCVALVQEMTRRSERVLGMLQVDEAPFSHEFVEQYVTIADKSAPAGGPTYRRLVHSYAAKLLIDVIPTADPDTQLAALDQALGQWQAGDVGFADVWTSLVTGMLDCDALCLVAAEVLSRRGWSVKLESTVDGSPQRGDGVDIGHVVLRVRPPITAKAAGADDGVSKLSALGDERLYDPSPFPIALAQSGKAAALPARPLRFEPYLAKEAAADEAAVRGLISAPK